VDETDHRRLDDPDQLKAYVTINLIVEAVLVYVVFIAATQVFSSIILSGVLSIALYVLVACIIIRGIKKPQRNRTSGQ